MERPERYEALYRKLSWGLLAVCILLGVTTIGDYGMGWDEVTRWKSGDAKVDYYKTLFSSENPISVIESVPTDAYPGFFDMTLSMLHRLTGWDRFILGHWQAFVFGLLGLVALWRIGSIFGGVRLGFWSVVLMIITPTFYGHWFHNPKDVPFAATYTIGLWALIECFRSYPVLRKRWVLVSAIACGLCMATRIAGMVLLAYCFAAVVAVLLTLIWENRKDLQWKELLREWAPWLIALCVVGAGAYLVLLPWWPGSHKNLLSVSGSTLQQLHVRAGEIPLLFRGTITYASEAPHYYTLWIFGLKATEVMLLGLLLAMPMGYLLAKRKLAEKGPLHAAPALCVLLLGGCFPLLYLTVTGPALHNGARHFLFAFPALAVCAAWGYLEASDWIRTKRPSMSVLSKVAFACLLCLPLWHLVWLHPYQYVYYNALAGGPSGAFGRYEGEYWFTSSKHAVEQLSAYVQKNPAALPAGRPVRVFILGPWQVAERFLPENFKLTANAEAADFLILNTQMMVFARFEGLEIFRIERMGMPVCVTLQVQ